MILALFWRALWWGLSFHKGQLGAEVNWIGFAFKLDAVGIKVSIKQEFMKDFGALVDELLRQRRVSLGEIRSFAGKANHICNLLYAWRPFISELWAAIYSRSAISSGRVWIKQIISTLLWMRCFLDGHRGALIRTWHFDDFLHPEAAATLFLDASPWGLGGILVIGCAVHSFFASKLTQNDEEIHGVTVGEHESQQVFEALSILVAVKLWINIFRKKRIVVTLTSDNTRALAMTATLKVTASSLIARELALLFSETSFQPRHVDHLPGVMNTYADALSRLYEPNAKYRIPEELRKAKQVHAPARTRSFYSTLAHTAQGG